MQERSKEYGCYAQIARKLVHKRKERRLMQRAVQQIVMHATPPAPLSLAEFDAELDALAEGSENRPAPSADVFRREHLYADHD